MDFRAFVAFAGDARLQRFLLASAEFSTPSDPVLPARYSDLDASPGSHWLENAPASSAIPLRI